MSAVQNGGILLDSWRRCEKAGLPQEPTERLYPLDSLHVQKLQERYQAVLSAFADAASACRAPKGTAFLLTDSQGILLKKNTG